MRSHLKESKVFGIALFGNGATIQKSPMMIFLGSSPNNPFALLDIVDCTTEMAKGGKKDAKYIAGLLKPIISRIEETKCWVRCRHCSNYKARRASGNYKARGASGNYKAWGASGRNYEARMVIFCILAAVNRFSWISWKEESR